MADRDLLRAHTLQQDMVPAQEVLRARRHRCTRRYALVSRIVGANERAFGQFYEQDPTRLAGKGCSAMGSSNKNTLQWVREILKRDGAQRAAASRRLG